MKLPNYGIDAPGVIRNLLIAGIILLLADHFADRINFIGFPIARIMGIVFIAEALLMLLYSKVGKFYHRDRMLSLVEWRGNETVLDVGTGAGLLMIGAAKKLSTGKSVGIDIWSEKDLSSNSARRALDNAAVEGVAGMVEVLNEDICSTTFTDATFDVVISNLCLHNIDDKAGRLKACREIARILKPGGVAIISDFKHTMQYAHEFKSSGLQVEKIGTTYLKAFPPLTIIRVTKVITS